MRKSLLSLLALCLLAGCGLAPAAIATIITGAAAGVSAGVAYFVETQATAIPSPTTLATPTPSATSTPTLK